MKSVVFIVGWLFVQPFLNGGLYSRSPEPQSSAPLALRVSPGAEDVIPLIERIWMSGFFQECEFVREEILNNDYALFDPQSSLAALKKQGMACYSRRAGENDTIFLREDIFAHFKVSLEGVFERRSVTPTALKVLVHELCHDFWANVLDEKERAFFIMDGMAFIEDYCWAVTKAEKQQFLFKAGQKARNPARSQYLADLGTLIASYPSCLLGPELFAWFGEKAFSAKMEIPPVFRKYYSGIITATFLRHGEQLS